MEGLATQRDENVGDILWTGRTDTNKRVVFRTDGVQEYFRAGDVSTAEISSLLLEQEAGVVHKFNNLVINGLTADEVTEFSSKSLTFLEPLPPLMPSLHGLDTIDVARLSLRNKIEAVSVPSPAISVADVVLKIIQERLRDSKNSTSFLTSVKKGDYIIVKITGAKGHTLRGEPIAKTTLQAAYELRLPQQ